MNFWDTDIPKSLKGLDLKTFLNKKRIIKYLYRQGTLSGSDISSILKISVPTSNLYLNELVAEGYIESTGKGESIGGRKPIVYSLKKNSVFILAIEIETNSFSLALFDIGLQRVVDKKVSITSLSDRQYIIDTIFSYVQKLLSEIGVKLESVMGVGISMPGLVNSDKGINYTYLYKKEISIINDFQKKFNRPVFLENDSKARALAEMKYGVAKGVKNALVLQIDWGLGLGMILNGKLYKGNSGLSGEFGHIQVENNGLLCKCGKTGCLETLASGEALIRMAIDGLQKNKQSKLYQVYIESGKNLSIDQIIDAVVSGDQFALSLITQVGTVLGEGISYLIQILNPELIILGGKVSRAGEYLITPIMQSLYKYCLPMLREDIEIKVSDLGTDIGTIGSAVVVIENLIENT